MTQEFERLRVGPWSAQKVKGTPFTSASASFSFPDPAAQRPSHDAQQAATPLRRSSPVSLLDHVRDSGRFSPDELDDLERAVEVGRQSRESSTESSDQRFSDKLTPYDGISEPLETFLARFENFASLFRWDEDERLFNLRNCLEKAVGNVLWDTGSPSSSQELIALLCSLAGVGGGRGVTGVRAGVG